MDLIKDIFSIITIPASLMSILNWLAGLSAILVLIIFNDQLVQKLTKNRLSLEKTVKGFLIGMRETVQLREGVQPWTFNRKIKKVGAYAFCAALAYGCIIFSALSISSVLMFILKKNVLTLDKAALAWGIILIFGWAARFAYVETRLAFKNAKSI
ncbi:hypothetical protein NQ788_06555 [Acinetobacter baumannii]|nr:hypothetical protein [Acinetobacter baumannii]